VPGNAPRFSANARGEGIKNIDMGIFKDFVVREGMKLELRAEFFNITNTVRFRTPDSFLGDTSFGKVTRQVSSSQAGGPRTGQLAIRFEF
jgi:hypothetical protein